MLKTKVRKKSNQDIKTHKTSNWIHPSCVQTWQKGSTDTVSKGTVDEAKHVKSIQNRLFHHVSFTRCGFPDFIKFLWISHIRAWPKRKLPSRAKILHQKAPKSIILHHAGRYPRESVCIRTRKNRQGHSKMIEQSKFESESKLKAHGFFLTGNMSFMILRRLPKHPWPWPLQHSANQWRRNSTVKIAMQTWGQHGIQWSIVWVSRVWTSKARGLGMSRMVQVYFGEHEELSRVWSICAATLNLKLWSVRWKLSSKPSTLQKVQNKNMCKHYFCSLQSLKRGGANPKDT